MPTYADQMREVERRRRLAQALVSGGSAPQGQQSGRFYVGPSNTSAIAGLAGILGGRYMNKRADREEKDARTAEQARLADAFRRLQGGGDPGVDGAATPPDPRTQAAQDVVGSLPLESQQQLLGGQAIQRMFPAAQPGFTLAPGAARYSADGKEVASRAPAESKADTGFSLSPGQTRFGADGKPIANVAAEPKADGVEWVDMSPAEIAAANLPAGTSAQRNQKTKAINVVSRRDNTGVLSQKDATTARQKLTIIQLAKQQLATVKAAFEKGIGGEGGITNAFGPGQGALPTQQGKAFDAALDQMRGTLTSITRVPGVGSMSDYESKIDQSKFPARGDYESVTAQKIQGLEDMLALIENGYTGLLSGGTAQQAQQPEAPQGGAPTVGTVDGGYRFKGGDPSKPENWEKQ